MTVKMEKAIKKDLKRKLESINCVQFSRVHPLFARVAQWWSIALPRRGSRVRIPSRALTDIYRFLEKEGYAHILPHRFYLYSTGNRPCFYLEKFQNERCFEDRASFWNLYEALSPNGKALDSDSSISRFESWQRCFAKLSEMPVAVRQFF